MPSVVRLYVVDYDSMVSGPIDHWRGNIDFDVYVGHISFNVGNIGTGNVYTFLIRASSSYSELLAGLGYTDVQERERLRAVFRRLYHLVMDLWWFGAVSVDNSGHTLLSLTEMLPHTVTCTYTLLKHVLCGQIYSPSLWVVRYTVVNCDIIILWLLSSILMFSYRQIIILSKYNICINLCFVLYIYIYVYICICMYIYMYMYVYVYVYVYVYMCVCVCACVCTLYIRVTFSEVRVKYCMTCYNIRFC